MLPGRAGRYLTCSWWSLRPEVEGPVRELGGGVPPQGQDTREPAASASRTALPADAGRPALLGRPPARVPAHGSARFPRPAGSPCASFPVKGLPSPGALGPWPRAGRSEEVGRERRFPHLTTGPQTPRRGLVSGGWGWPGRLVSLRRDPQPREGPEALKPSLPSPPHLTPGSQNILSRSEPPTPDAGDPDGPRAPRAASARPAPREERAGSRPLGPNCSPRLRPGVPSFPSSPAVSCPRLRPSSPGFSRRLTRPARLPFQSGRRGPHARRLRPWDR